MDSPLYSPQAPSSEDTSESKTPDFSSGVVITNTSLDALQSDEQRCVLDTVSQVRKCGLQSILDLPQIVVCGDQSSGKSSVLEAVTGIPFPRNDNLCTRFATEISLRRATTSSLTIRVIPDPERPQREQDKLKDYSESITDFEHLPKVMANATEVMGISEEDSAISRAFAKDTLSIEIQGPELPQLTLVDIPGLIQAATKGISEADVAMVAGITESYIKQPRTICLAVVAATNDAANQPILQRVRSFDPSGERTLGVITKPDRLSAGSGSEDKFLQLARNEDVFFKLGWHVVKNRNFEERDASIEERNLSEKLFFTTSNFRTLPKVDVGIEALRIKLSHLLFQHVKKELPKLHEDLETALKFAQDELKVLGDSRSSTDECRAFLAQLTHQCYEICKNGLSGNYGHSYFRIHDDEPFSEKSDSATTRIRAIVQHVNFGFAENFRKNGQKYLILDDTSPKAAPDDSQTSPQRLSEQESMAWAKKVLQRSRGTEPIGNFNPNIIAELFWELSERWEKLSKAHVELISQVCHTFLRNLLAKVAPSDVKQRMWSLIVQGALSSRRQSALDELDRLLKDSRDFQINYNHYYTDTINQKRQARMKEELLKHIPEGNIESRKISGEQVDMNKEIEAVISRWGEDVGPDMEVFSCREALDCSLAIYKVQQKVFIANVVTQVVERHLVRGLDSIFAPMGIIKMPNSKIEALVSEPAVIKKQRAVLTERIKNLEGGQEVFRSMIAL